MKKENIFWLLLVLFLFSCGQNISTQQKIQHDSIYADTKHIADLQLAIDSNKIAILSSQKITFFSLKDSMPAKLINNDIPTIELLLAGCIKKYNTGSDSTKLYSDYIDLKKYKRQYVPYTNAKGEKTVFINCFCRGVPGFEQWKEKITEIDNGGKCFFNVTINITRQTCGPVLINGPG